MEEECRFDFDVEIMEQIGALHDDDSFDFDDYSSGIEVETYDP